LPHSDGARRSGERRLDGFDDGNLSPYAFGQSWAGRELAGVVCFDVPGGEFAETFLKEFDSLL